MRVSRSVQVCVLAAALLLPARAHAASATFKLCGRKLGEIMSRVCHVYNSPSWDVPSVVEPASTARRKRQAGIADECCTYGCTWAQLSEYCSISANSEALLEGLEAHLIADRSAEQESKVTSPRARARAASAEVRQSRSREVGGGGRARGRRCRCRRKRRLGRRRRRPDLMGNMELLKNAVRAAPVVGTVSPLLTWGRTLYTNLPSDRDRDRDRDRSAYVAVYTA